MFMFLVPQKNDGRVPVSSTPLKDPVPFREFHEKGYFLYMALAPYNTASYEDFAVSLRLLILIKNW